MKKYVLVGMVLAFSGYSIAGKDKSKSNAVAVQQISACKGFWKPKIKEAQEALQAVREVWEGMNAIERSLDQEVFEKVIFFERLQEKRTRALHFCIGNNLQESRREYAEVL